MDTLRDAIDRAGGTAKTARCIGVSQQVLCNWLRRNAVPAERAIALSAALGLRPHAIRPDVYLPEWTIPEGAASGVTSDAAA